MNPYTLSAHQVWTEQIEVGTMLLISNRDVEENILSVRVLCKSDLGAKPRAKAIAAILQARSA